MRRRSSLHLHVFFGRAKGETQSDFASQIQQATGLTNEEVLEVINIAQEKGRVILELSTDLERLISIGAKLSSCGLHITIRSGRDTFREEVAGLLLKWVLELCSNPTRQFMQTITQIVCDELLSTWGKDSIYVDRILGNPPDGSKGFLQIDLMLLHSSCVSTEVKTHIRQLYSIVFADFPQRKRIIISRFATLYRKLTGKSLGPLAKDTFAMFNKLEEEFDFVTSVLGPLHPYSLVMK
ncbi:hypothetical protein K493DRAFT_71521 [Basidiobolus meristosporus CBS 931.73]|uniref:Uncharacterized protein n=1 Tax=Basidiobolus meristosporus CBS 931.73 TaxID=1314790 RepID=A0A1Y1XTN3_9FUNG|nr:hypothetical protein K493DRAFT_71521 [Basidiobolus meristosporus CBS 931.73]|eukprot:ORX89100.1 hypothetical protein K493DRAFT_71521 [Basidiobolus meristosporus CBS 931.73]